MNGFSFRKFSMAALFISLALNLFLGGFLLARNVYTPDHSRPEGPMHVFPKWDGEKNAATEKYRLALRERHPQMRQGFRAFRNARENVKVAMSAEPFDRQRLEVALLDMRKATLALQAVSQDALLEVSPTLTTAERRDLVEALNLRISGAAGGLHPPHRRPHGPEKGNDRPIRHPPLPAQP